MAERYCQCDGVEERRVDEETFLIAEEIGTIHHLNTTGAAVWRLLRAPVARAEIVATLAVAFPGTDEQVIDDAVVNLLRELEAEQLILVAGGDDADAGEDL